MNFENISLESVAKYWNSRPCNIRHSIKPLATKEYFEEVQWRKYFIEYHIPEFANFEAYRNKKVLDAGCGLGTMTMGFARVAEEVTAIDLSTESLELAKKRAEIYQLKNIEFIHADCENLLESVNKKNYFDLVFSFGVIHHTPHPLKALKNFHELLKIGGTLKLMVYYKYSWKVLWIFLKYGRGRFWRLKELVAMHSEAQTGCPITYIYGKKELTKILTEIGFEVKSIQPEHIFPYKIEKYVKYEYEKVWYFRWLPEKLFLWLEKKMGWHLCITAIKI